MVGSCSMAETPKVDSQRVYVPHVDIIEKEGDVVLYVNLPGAASESIDIQYEDGQLTIEASVADRQSVGTKYLLREYGVGRFRRSFQLANSFDASRIEASYRNGVLTLKLPKAEEAKPRRIEVKA
ncbi:Hsp20/alpha crystallin family protein [bacterium]|jgi:HSP20 family protein|nr:Hsp20/alpha crystallin family protein [bacterium]